MDNNNILREDLAIQKQKLINLQALGSPSVLIENQTALIAEIEKQLSEAQAPADKEN